jgi:transposase
MPTLDAALIADYCRTQQPPAWTPPAPEVKKWRALVRHLDDLKDERQRARNRLEAQTVSQAVARQLKKQVTLHRS